MGKLYDLSEAMSALAEQMEDEFFTFDPAQVDKVFTDFGDKIENCVKFRKNEEAEAEMFKAESERLAKKAATCQARADWMKAYISGCMINAKTDKIKAGVFAVTMQANAPVAEVNAAVDKLPDKYLRVVPASKEVDKKAILDDWKANKDTEGFSLPAGVVVTVKKSLRVR